MFVKCQSQSQVLSRREGVKSPDVEAKLQIIKMLSYFGETKQISASVGGFY